MEITMNDKQITTAAETAVTVYDAEVALHIARQAGVDSWIKAAADRLHDALQAHLLAVQPHPYAA